MEYLQINNTIKVTVIKAEIKINVLALLDTVLFKINLNILNSGFAPILQSRFFRPAAKEEETIVLNVKIYCAVSFITVLKPANQTI